MMIQKISSHLVILFTFIGVSQQLSFQTMEEAFKGSFEEEATCTKVLTTYLSVNGAREAFGCSKDDETTKEDRMRFKQYPENSRICTESLLAAVNHWQYIEKYFEELYSYIFRKYLQRFPNPLLLVE